MHAVEVCGSGGPEVLRWSEVEDPVPAAREVVIDIVAAGVNRADTQLRSELYPPQPGASAYLGLECSGQIVALGEDVTEWKIGDKVCALLSGGGYAERVAVHASLVLPVPSKISLRDAAALPEVACTVWSNIFMDARLRPGEVLLVHGGASGIGTFALQIANAYGARVFCTASAGRLDNCSSLGAHRPIDYRSEDFVSVVLESTAGHGADVILDIIGGDYTRRNLDALATRGRLSIIGLQGGSEATLDLSTLLAKRASITGTTLRPRPLAEKAAIIKEVREHVWPMVSAGLVVPVIDRVIAMKNAAEAHRVVEGGGHIGKVLLVRP